MSRANWLDKLPALASGLCLCRHKGDELILCESVIFPGGAAVVDMVLRRAAISGRVEIDGEIADYFADVLNANGDIIETVALDAGSYRALKTKWMRCRVERI